MTVDSHSLCRLRDYTSLAFRASVKNWKIMITHQEDVDSKKDEFECSECIDYLSTGPKRIQVHLISSARKMKTCHPTSSLSLTELDLHILAEQANVLAIIWE